MYLLSSHIKKSHLHEPATFHSFEIAKNLEQFFFLSSNSQSSFPNQPIRNQKQYVSTALELISKGLSTGLNKIWVKLLFIDTLVSACDFSCQNCELVDYLSEIIKVLGNDLNDVKSQQLSRTQFFGSNNSLFKTISTWFLKFKSTVYSPNDQFQIEGKKLYTTEQSIPTSRQPNHQKPILQTLLHQILLYERLKLQDNDFYQEIKEKHKQSGPFTASKETKLQFLVQKVWKIINIIKPQSLIVSTYKKICFVVKDIKPMMVATIYRLCKDSLMFYPYITECIQLGVWEVQLKYDKILAEKLPKYRKYNKLQQLRKSEEFIDLQNLINQLSEITQTLLYLFCSNQHCIYLDIEAPKNFFLSTNNRRLDKIYSIMTQLKKVQKKNHLSKIYMTQIVEKLDESVSRVLQIERIRNNSWVNIRNEGKGEGSCEPTHEEQEWATDLAGKKREIKKAEVFEEFTQNV